MLRLPPGSKPPVRLRALLLLAAAGATPAAAAPVPPVPAPQSIPKPGPAGDGPYAPAAILPGGVVMALWAPASPQLDQARVREPEEYTLTKGVPGRIQSIVNVHNPSIEVHTADPVHSTGAAVILLAGGAHNSLNVGTEGGDVVAYLYNYGVAGVILRNRLRRDGYDPRTDAVADTLQAVRLLRAHAGAFGIDPNRIGLMGFSAGAELVAAAAIEFAAFDERARAAQDPLAKVSSRPDFVALLYPGPTPFARGENPPIPRNAPPSFVATAGSGDQGHALWADDYFRAMLAVGVPNLEMHVYGNGEHANGLKDRGGTPFGTWPARFIDWFRDLGFLQKPGLATKAAADVAAYVAKPPRPPRGLRPAAGTPEAR